ncbi:MAG: cupin domain-containing protein [Cyclobacteriaceae bacterium]|nr:cupin domain-containing protein [Cyclobacteriaceae bacterium]
MQIFNNLFNAKASFNKLNEYWSPKVINEFNGNYIKIAKLKGEFVWHKHEKEDELFLIIKGNLTIDFEHESVDLKEGDGYVVPKGVMHNPHCKDECWVMLIEPKETMHTGNVRTDKSKSIDQQLV